MTNPITSWVERNPEWAMDEAEEVVSLYPTHPGELLKSEVLPARKIKGSELAEAICASRSEVSNILNGRKAITPLMALRIEAATHYPADLLMRLQVAHDLAYVREQQAAMLSGIRELA